MKVTYDREKLTERERLLLAGSESSREIFVRQFIEKNSAVVEQYEDCSDLKSYEASCIMSRKEFDKYITFYTMIEFATAFIYEKTGIEQWVYVKELPETGNVELCGFDFAYLLYAQAEIAKMIPFSMVMMSGIESVFAGVVNSNVSDDNDKDGDDKCHG